MSQWRGPVRPRGRWRDQAVDRAQPAGSAISPMHHVSRADSRLEQRPGFSTMTRAPLILALALGAALEAQQVVTPTEDRVGPVRGDNIGNYNVVNGFETGYRFRRIDGNEGKYRSDVNYGNGLRLFSSSLAVNSRDGHGGLFEEILLTTLGLGN